MLNLLFLRQMFCHSGVVTSSDIPYTEYLAKINRSLLPEYKKVEPKHLMTDQ